MSAQATLCRSRSQFGACGLDADHDGDMHAVPIGDDVWFGYRSSRGREATRVGYGRFAEDGFRLLLTEQVDSPTT
ncbi:hypothetical protein ACFFX1_55320 [Dactylosporangium sucinum]|uniref:Uncharacterized protein n=1 Tax=Dactylosporangium sucinum TaxID=1424081 RepID=A0A917X1J3_9ACTN|nr:hypothetical protein [Dactylosporangium sucinum]GGM52841.1 hypothetical protein GCM10007977_063000 [Dactylosporangium sucinum]